MFGKEKIMELLLANSTVLNLVDKFTDDKKQQQYAIYNDSKLPHSNNLERTINFYRNKDIEGWREYGEYVYRFACRANGFAKAEEIGVAVYNVFNRYSTGRWHFICELKTIVPPKDENDNHNCIVDVKINEITVN